MPDAPSAPACATAGVWEDGAKRSQEDRLGPDGRVASQHHSAAGGTTVACAFHVSQQSDGILTVLSCLSLVISPRPTSRAFSKHSITQRVGIVVWRDDTPCAPADLSWKHLSPVRARFKGPLRHGHVRQAPAAWITLCRCLTLWRLLLPLVGSGPCTHQSRLCGEEGEVCTLLAPCAPSGPPSLSGAVHPNDPPSPILCPRLSFLPYALRRQSASTLRTGPRQWGRAAPSTPQTTDPVTSASKPQRPAHTVPTQGNRGQTEARCPVGMCPGVAPRRWTTPH